MTKRKISNAVKQALYTEKLHKRLLVIAKKLADNESIVIIHDSVFIVRKKGDNI